MSDNADIALLYSNAYREGNGSEESTMWGSFTQLKRIKETNKSNDRRQLSEKDETRILLYLHLLKGPFSILDLDIIYDQT